jgi:protein-tyrosine phosphatase
MRIDWIDDHIALSGAIDDYNELEKQGIDFVINTRYECHDDIIELGKHGISYFWFPIVDNFPPTTFTLRSLLNLVKKNPDKKILIHCTLGMGRSATLVLMYLIYKYELSVEEAITRLQTARPEAYPTQMQLEKLHKYYDRIRKGE